MPKATPQIQKRPTETVVAQKSTMITHNKASSAAGTMIGNTQAPRVVAAEKMLANPNGSIWAATAAQNAALAQAGQATFATDPTVFKIQHNNRKVLMADASGKPPDAHKMVGSPTSVHGKVIAPTTAPAPQPPKDPTVFRIDHSAPAAPAPAPKPAPQPAPAPQPVAQTVVAVPTPTPVASAPVAAAPVQTTASGGVRAVADGEDGIVLRWR
jgi:hypothetical protein